MNTSTKFKNKKKNKRHIQQQINEEFDNYLELINSNTSPNKFKITNESLNSIKLNSNILEEENKDDNKIIKNTKTENNKFNIKFDDIENLESKISEIPDYHLIKTPFKIFGEEILNEEINKKYKSKLKSNPENNQIMKKLKGIFKKLVYKDAIDKPNISQILLDNNINEDIKIKILRKYIKFVTEEEVFSEEADKIKIEIKNLIKHKKIRTSDDFEELEKKIELKVLPPNLKIKLEEIYYRVINGDQSKLQNFLNNLLNLPFEKKNNIFDQISNSDHKIKVEFIKSIYSKLHQDLYGLEETKDSIMSWICQKINNPTHKSTKYLCLCGPAGVGKTSIINSISDSLKIPYSYISLANIDEPSSLIGHGYTYEGSEYGYIADGLIKNGCINGILLFDELDKAKEKVQNTLLGIFDPLQNNKFRDAYFGEFYLDLSECMMIICLNDLNKVNPILKDRLHVINIPGYSIKDKKIIISNYILPKLQIQYNIDVIIEHSVINEILEKTKEFQGIRQIQMYLIKIYEFMILDKYTKKYNFNNSFTLKNINLLKINESHNNSYMNMFS